MWLNIEMCFREGRKHSGKRRKCWLPIFFPFPTMFSKAFFLRVVKRLDCQVKSKTKLYKDVPWMMLHLIPARNFEPFKMRVGWCFSGRGLFSLCGI